MAKKAPAKAVKKTVKKAAKSDKVKPIMEQKVKEVTQQETVQAPASVAVEGVNEVKQDIVKNEAVQVASVEEKKEESTMAEGEKGIGKAYNPAEFSQPATEASGGSSKIFLYTGIGVGVLAVVVLGLFFLGGLSNSGESNVTGATVITAHCTDTDGGYNRFTKGVADGTYYLDYSEGQFMDECASGEENKLTEYYCKGDLVVYATEPCADGMTCQDGICVSVG